MFDDDASIRCPAERDCVLGAALLARGADSPGRPFIRFEDGPAWTYADALGAALRTAGGLRALGVAREDPVLVWLPNGPDLVRIWFACCLLGAVFVPVNTGYRGRLLEHVLHNAAPRLAVVHAELTDRLRDVTCPTLRHIVVLGDRQESQCPSPMAGVTSSGHGSLDAPPIEAGALPDVRPWDLQAIVYTSGTTGLSKGVLTTHLHLASMALGGRDMIGGDDHRLVALPLFHSGGLQSVFGALLTGGSLSLVRSFRTETFWDTVRQSGATTVTLLGAMIGFLMKAPPHPDEARHRLRNVFLVPFPADGPAFARRFGVTVWTNYNSTETCNTLVSERDPVKPGVCGRPRAGISARLVDDHDFDVPAGAVGELVLRTALPWAMSHGYHRDAEATAAAWRNGWFHTGELFRVDADGDWFFVDRKKDALRRRGENISSAEVEREILAHPAVLEAAVVAVPSEFGEDDVLAVVALRPERAVTPRELVDFLQPRLAHFMVPRYVRLLDRLPRTETHKVQKYLLRRQGLTDDTWDRDAAGIRVRPQPLSALPGDVAMD